MKLIAYLSSFAFALIFSPLCHAQSFNMSVEQFQKAYDIQVKKEAMDQALAPTIKSVVKMNQNAFRVTLNDGSFQKMVKHWKELNLANGKFTLKDHMILTTDASGKLTRVGLFSVREDMNIFHFIGTVASVVKVFNPNLKNDELTKLISETRLMSGDSDPEIGQVHNNFTKGAAVSCLQQHSSVSPKVMCLLTPRF